ncbi:MAG: hypothetical protein ACP5QU_07125 [Anaerolineae bacterium]
MADNNIPFLRRTWVQLTFWLILAVGGYGLYVYRLGGWKIIPHYLRSDAWLFVALFFLWLMFFAQFILPVQRLSERRQIIIRLLLTLIGKKGPAIFIEDGQPKEREHEEEREGPGVLWLDTASGAVTRTATAFRQTLGPGVHFTAAHEKIAGTVDLRRQMQRLGPYETDDPFAVPADPNDATYKEMQRRRAATTALTRDGIEVVPNISVIFKIDADPVTHGPGSRFGYNQEAVFKAIAGEAINPDKDHNSSQYHVPWNKLPALIAADLWREYLSKFTLKELFEAGCPEPEPPPEGQRYLPPSVANASRPVRAASRWVDEMTQWLHEANLILGAVTRLCRTDSGTNDREPSPAPPTQAQADQKPRGKVTAFQLINNMVRNRMISPQVAELDQYGRPTGKFIASREFQLLSARGIRVIAVAIANLRFPPEVENEFIQHWKATWLETAQAERARIEEQRKLAALSGQEKALAEYTTNHLSREIARLKDAGIKGLKEVVCALVMRSRTALIRNRNTNYHPVTELDELEEIIQWIESD